MKLDKSFYLQGDVVWVAENLLGKFLFTRFGGELTGGLITETEAYNGIIDRASHAFGGKRTGRTEVMYAEGGTAYVYLCYGIHSLFNVVTNKKEIPHAVLVRSVMPTHGVTAMLRRSGKVPSDKSFCRGPGNVSKALGIHYSHTGLSLTGNEIWIEHRKLLVKKSQIKVTSRIGVDYAGDDALLPYRFVWSP